MTVIFLTEHNCGNYAVIFENNGCIKVQKVKVIPNHQINNLYIKPSKRFLSKSEVFDMTLMSGAIDESVFDRNTNLLEISEEDRKHG